MIRLRSPLIYLQLIDYMELASFQQNIMDDTIDLSEEHFEMKLPVINE